MCVYICDFKMMKIKMMGDDVRIYLALYCTD